VIRLVAVCVFLAAWHAVPDRFRLWTVIALLGAVDLGLAVLAIAGVAAHRWVRRRRRIRSERDMVERDVSLLGELVLLALTAGLPFVASLAAAAEHLSAPLRREIVAIVRYASVSGADVALAGAGGPAAGLFGAVAGATSSGASVVDAVAGFVDERRQATHTARLGAARRLPVRLMVPLALLMLPGFVLLTVAPAMVGAIERFGS
jgi:hypothetical protein